MALRPDKLAELGLYGPTSIANEPVAIIATETRVVVVTTVAIPVEESNLEVGAQAKAVKNPKRERMGFYWQELNKKYWAADGTGIRCGTCAFFKDGTKATEPRKDEYNLVGTCGIMDIEDAKVHSQACCNLYRRPRDDGGVNPENEMWPPTYPASCPPAKGRLVLRDCGVVDESKADIDKLEKAKASLAQELKSVKEQKATADKKAIALSAQVVALKKANQELLDRQKRVQTDRVELKKQAADAAQKLTKTTASVQQTLSAVQKTA